MGVKTSGALSAKQMLSIARSRYEGQNPLRPSLRQEFATAVEWGEGALELARVAGERGMELLAEDFLHEVRKHHDMEWRNPFDDRANLPNEEFFVTIITSDGYTKSGSQLRLEETDFLRGEPSTGVAGDGYDIHEYYHLCRGDHTNSHHQHLTCSLTNNNHPYLLLAPLKQEILSSDPPLLLYHNVLTEEEVEFLTTHMEHKLSPATVQDNSVADGKKVSGDRVQASGWSWDQEHPQLYKLSKKTAAITQLRTARPPDMGQGRWGIIEAEAWQVGLYGPGGHYLPHFDAFDIPDHQWWGEEGLWVGNRMATTMFYLSDLLGGTTAFPKIGVAARPSRGSALFWYNLNSDGVRDNMSLHGACPVVRGIKWVTNKWIREGEQIWARPCVSVTNNLKGQ